MIDINKFKEIIQKMKKKICIKTWNQNGMTIYEVDFDGDRHAFEIYVDGMRVVTIYADSPEQTEDVRAILDAGGDVRDWEDAIWDDEEAWRCWACQNNRDLSRVVTRTYKE